MSKRKTYEYRTVVLTAMYDVTLLKNVEDKKYRETKEVRDSIDRLLADGFRWIRSDENRAIFERASAPAESSRTS